MIVCVGPEAAQETIRTALAVGADTGVLLKADTVGLDPLPVARALAAELKDGGYDLVLFGKMAMDDSSHAVGPMVAELLGLPCVSAATHLQITDGTGKAEREIEGGVEEKVKIWMNHPLRHGGFTLFQRSFGSAEGDPRMGRQYSVFDVVNNPADQWPLYSLIIVGVGMGVHFVQKLWSYLKRALSKSAATA